MLAALCARSRGGAGRRATACESLASLSQPKTAVTLARTGRGRPVHAAGGSSGRGRGGANPFAQLPAFCRVAATLTPTSDSDIKIEVWLPASGWNGKFQAVGNGAWAGTISYPAMATALAAGYGTVSTDTGHAGGNANFMVGHPEKLVDFEERAVHEMTVAGEGDRRGLLRQRAEAGVLQRLLDGRPAGADGSPALSARLRRHRRRRAGQLREAPDVRPDLAVAGDAQRRGEPADGREVSGAPQSRARGLRRARRREGRRARESDAVQVRSEGHAVQGPVTVRTV